MASDITYSSYLDLDRILAAQHPASDAHDEMLFIIVHQASELWLKLCLHELSEARECIREDR
ncbi:MAG: tryptophan 2,3-dioxygenase family protein, partial [Pseudomonadota bacterium]